MFDILVLKQCLQTHWGSGDAVPWKGHAAAGTCSQADVGTKLLTFWLKALLSLPTLLLQKHYLLSSQCCCLALHREEQEALCYTYIMLNEYQTQRVITLQWDLNAWFLVSTLLQLGWCIPTFYSSRVSFFTLMKLYQTFAFKEHTAPKE